MSRTYWVRLRIVYPSSSGPPLDYSLKILASAGTRRAAAVRAMAAARRVLPALPRPEFHLGVVVFAGQSQYDKQEPFPVRKTLNRCGCEWAIEMTYIDARGQHPTGREIHLRGCDIHQELLPDRDSTKEIGQPAS